MRVREVWCLGIRFLESSFCWFPSPGVWAGRGDFFVGGGGRVRLAAFWVHAWRRRDDVDIVCTTVGATVGWGTPGGV